VHIRDWTKVFQQMVGSHTVAAIGRVWQSMREKENVHEVVAADVLMN
jgi:hypothetical protein